MQWRRVGQRVRSGRVVRPVDRELLDDHVPAGVRYRRDGRVLLMQLRRVVGGRGRALAGYVARLFRRQRLRCAPTELTVPLSFYLVISFLLLLVLVQVVQHVMQHQIVTVLVLSLRTNIGY